MGVVVLTVKKNILHIADKNVSDLTRCVSSSLSDIPSDVS